MASTVKLNYNHKALASAIKYDHKCDATILSVPYDHNLQSLNFYKQATYVYILTGAHKNSCNISAVSKCNWFSASLSPLLCLLSESHRQLTSNQP